MSNQFLQRALSCPCGPDKVLALELCPTCYTLRRQDEATTWQSREGMVRDGYRCRVSGCHIAGNQKRALAVHHRVPGNSHPIPDDHALSRSPFNGDAYPGSS